MPHHELPLAQIITTLRRAEAWQAHASAFAWALEDAIVAIDQGSPSTAKVLINSVLSDLNSLLPSDLRSR